MVRQFQEIYFNARTEGTLNGYSNPDFIKLVNAYGIDGFRLKTSAEIDNTIQQFLQSNTASFLEVMLPARQVSILN